MPARRRGPARLFAAAVRMIKDTCKPLSNEIGAATTKARTRQTAISMFDLDL